MNVRVAFLVAVALAAPPALLATDLDQQTLKAWDQYVQTKDAELRQAQVHQRVAGSASFLWIDDVPDGRARVRRGEVLAEPARKGSPQKVPHGLIHDWIGCIFIPRATIRKVTAVINDYARYNEFYDPAVVSAKLLGVPGKKQTFSMELVGKEAFVTAAIESEYVSQTIKLDERRQYMVISSTRIQQIEDYGHSGEHMLPPDKGSGFVWRLYAVLKFEQRDGGVYAECEAVVLSRDVPFEFEWLVRPILQRLPRNSMQAMLCKTRDAVNGSDAVEVKFSGELKRAAPNLSELGIQPSTSGP